MRRLLWAASALLLMVVCRAGCSKPPGPAAPPPPKPPAPRPPAQGEAAATAPKGLPPEELANRNLERRAVQAVIWGMSAVNTDLMLQEMLTKTPGKVNQVV